MAFFLLEKYLPEQTFPLLQKWIGQRPLHIKITKERQSKLGDYRQLEDRSHQISINATLPPFLFFFVLTHELAHLLAFERFGHRIAPHGSQWKATFGEMIVESLYLYPEDLRPILKKFSLSPKANFMASPDLVSYFRLKDLPPDFVLVKDLPEASRFVYNRKNYQLLRKMKKNYLCKNIDNGKSYVFQSIVPVKPLK
ncbi:SprT-like domain-containing protein [Bergeyella sp. RCAD1439]|uniref:SprT-like domain-containing protein n=1 Tax=Bergeyella anatis TaxID=3113737 RepID=UPI002E18FE7B|nr:SprT-like domain-containing protein [Bergeyella sp. RCAD1439]